MMPEQDNRTSEHSKESLEILSLTDRISEELDPGLRKRSRPKTKRAPKAKLALAKFQTKYFV